MAILTNYAIQCKDVTSGKVGTFLFDTSYWQSTGQFKALSPVFGELIDFYAWDNENGKRRQPCYFERNQ